MHEHGDKNWAEEGVSRETEEEETERLVNLCWRGKMKMKSKRVGVDEPA